MDESVEQMPSKGTGVLMKKIIFTITTTLILSGCIEVEDSRSARKVDEVECYRMAKELGGKHIWNDCGFIGICYLVIHGDTMRYEYKMREYK